MTADQSSGPAQAEPGKTAIRAAESELEFILSGLLTLLVGGTLYYVYSLFEALAPPWRLNLWAAGTGFVTVLMLATPLAYFAFRPGAEAIERYWSPFGKLVAVLFDLSVASSVWLLLPYASEPLRLLMVLFYSAAISGQVISTAESIWTNLFAVVSIFGSAALFFLQSETAYAVSLAVFLMAFGGLLLVVALILKQAIRSAIESRMEAERVSKELAVALADAQAARDARTRFIATASHDLRQPLQAAMLFFEQVTRQADPQRRDRAIAGVRNGFAEANAMLERMMEHLRIESGAVSVQREAVALGPLFAALADELQPGAQRAGMDLRALASRLHANADRTLLARILRNLLQNAIIHSQGRKVRLWARGRPDGRLDIFVADDGTGLSPEFAAAAFDAYSQGRQAAQRGSGMGLGLSIARELARAMGGDLELVPGRARGAAFRLILPRSAQADTPVCEPPAPNGAMLAGLAVLVIEDDRAGAEALAGLLAQHGAEARIAPDRAALEAVLGGEWQADAVITDWHIGTGLTGAQAATLVRERWPQARIAVMTGDGTTATVKAIDATGWPCLWKPVDPAELLRIVGR